ncbi:MAG: DNA topoisomerase IV subunit A [Alphaproteobacteria bacterium]|nr:DNA topoisomerase IV subunit A [Alphaproteobacteria bacterium]
MNATPPARTAEMRPVDFSDALSERYLAYALSTIMSRSLPDVRDGLKPVQRRLIYAMRELKLDPGSAFKKCARVVGDVIGKYHPHGDSAVYEALVRLAQDFALRYPLIEGQGNFGNIDGDNAAAMRYTEARLTDVAGRLMEGLDEDAVDFRATYDGSEHEPVVMPANFPNLLANGATGIAVGLATSIPPHNVAELVGALKVLLDDPKCSLGDLCKHVKGPDFPTGGILVEPKASISAAYAEGRGSFRLRARYEIEELARGTWQIVITEIPHHVQKGWLIERIAELIDNKKIAFLESVLDESTDVVRIVLEPKSRTVDPVLLIETLFRQTDLETRVSLNMNVLDKNNVPRLMNLKQVLEAYLEHRLDVLKRRSKHRVGVITNRLEVLGGYLIAYLNLDEVIHIIRREEEPKAVLIKRFKITDVQAEAILNMRLRALRKLEEIEIRKEHDALSKEKADLEALLGSQARQKAALGKELDGLLETYGAKTALGARRTEIGAVPEPVDMPAEALIEREPITVIFSGKGWVRALKGHAGPEAEVKYKEGDQERFRFHAETTDKLVLFATNGRFYTLGADKLSGGRGFGEPVRLMVELGNDQEIVALFVHKPGRKLLVASSDGRGFFVQEDEVLAQTRTGKQVLNIGDGAEAAICVEAEGDHVAVIGTTRRLAIFKVEELPEMTRGRGVILQRYNEGTLEDAQVFWLKKGLSWTTATGVRTQKDLAGWIGERGAKGRLPPKGFPRSNRFS